MNNFNFKTAQWEHQKRVFNFSENLLNWGLFATMGSGKTKMYLDYLALQSQKGLVDSCMLFAPKGIHEQWQESQIPLHFSVLHYDFLWEPNASNTKKYEKKFDDFMRLRDDRIKIFIINVESLGTSKKIGDYIKRFMSDHEKIAIAIDEITCIKNMSAQRTKKMLRFTRHKKIVSRCGMTGTEVTETPANLYSIIDFINPGFWHEPYQVFVDRYCIQTKMVNHNNNSTYMSTINAKDSKLLASYFMRVKNGFKIKGTEHNWTITYLSRVPFSNKKIDMSLDNLSYLYDHWIKSGCDPDWVLSAITHRIANCFFILQFIMIPAP